MNWLAAAAPVVSGCNDWSEFIQKLFSGGSRLLSLAGGEHHHRLRHELDRLERCMLNLPGLISEAEWFIYKDTVAPLLHRLKDRLLDAHDLLDAFNYHYELKVTAEGTHHLRADFFKEVINFNRVKKIREDIEYLDDKLAVLIDRRTEMQRFDKFIRPDMDHCCDDSRVRGREAEVDEVIRRLGVLPELHHTTDCSVSSSKRCTTASTTSTSKRTRRTLTASNSASLTNTRAMAQTATIVPASEPICSEQTREPISFQCDEQRTANVSVFIIIGIGGIGKTTLGQKVFNDKRVHDHFDLRIWISVTNDFDVKRLTKEFVHHILKNEMQSDNLSCLQDILTGGIIASKKFLLVLDDIWDDVYINHESRWHIFIKPLQSAPGKYGFTHNKVTKGCGRREAYLLIFSRNSLMTAHLVGTHGHLPVIFVGTHGHVIGVSLYHSQ